MNTLNRKGWVTALSLVIAIVLGAAAPPHVLAADQRESQFTSADHREMWQKGSDQVLSGDFRSAAKTLSQLHQNAPDSNVVEDVLGWAEQCNKLSAARDRLRAKIFDYHSAKAQAYEAEALARDAKGEPKPPPEPEPAKAADKVGKNSKAKKKEPTTWKDVMGEVYTSMQNASNEDEFRKLDWVARISAESAKAATRLRDQRDWKEAYVLFELLRLTFPDNEGYKRESRDCRLHAHFE